MRMRGRGGLLLDCGEGTLGQIARFLSFSRPPSAREGCEKGGMACGNDEGGGAAGAEEGVTLSCVEKALLELKCVWISHMHADHHLGMPACSSARVRCM